MREEARPESPRTHPRESSFISLMSGWAQQGVQSYFATQRLLIDLAMRQNSSLVHVLKERLSDPRHSPSGVLTELASEGMSNLYEAQKVLLDLAQRQNEIVMSGVKEGIGASSTVAAMADLLRRSVDSVIEMQREFLKIANKHTHPWMEAAKSGKLPKDGALVDLAREAVDSFVRAQKQFLDAVAEEISKATHRKPSEASRKVRKTEMAELGRQATDSFIEAQKKLADVAGRQVNATLKTAGRTMDILRPLPVIPISDWTREGVKSFVDAQKALMDAVTKPHNGTKAATRMSRTPKRVRGARIRTHEKAVSHQPM